MKEYYWKINKIWIKKSLYRNKYVERIKDYVQKMNYGCLSIDSTNIDTFWLERASELVKGNKLTFHKDAITVHFLFLKKPIV